MRNYELPKGPLATLTRGVRPIQGVAWSVLLSVALLFRQQWGSKQR